MQARCDTELPPFIPLSGTPVVHSYWAWKNYKIQVPVRPSKSGKNHRKLTKMHFRSNVSSVWGNFLLFRVSEGRDFVIFSPFFGISAPEASQPLKGEGAKPGTTTVPFRREEHSMDQCTYPVRNPGITIN